MSRKADKQKENRLHSVFSWLLEFDQRHRFYLKRLKAPAGSPETEAERAGARELLEVSLEILRACHSVSGNPLFTWWAVKVCIEAELPFPAWVQAYLARSAQALLMETISTKQRPPATPCDRCCAG